MKIGEFIKKEKFEIGREVIISIFIAAIVSASVSFYFDRVLDTRTSKRQFFYEFSRTFFDNPQYRNVSIALEEQYLYSRGKILSANGGPFSDYDIDNYLYFLYDLYSFADEDLISYDLVSEQYSYYVCITYNNPEIRGYRDRLLKEGFSDWQAIGYLDDFAKILKISKDTNCKAL